MQVELVPAIVKEAPLFPENVQHNLPASSVVCQVRLFNPDQLYLCIFSLAFWFILVKIGSATNFLIRFSGGGGGGMTPSSKCYDLIKRFEGCRLEAYQDSVGVWTIGWGTTRYPDGSPVSPGDKITQAEADYYLEYEVLDYLAHKSQTLS